MGSMDTNGLCKMWGNTAQENMLYTYYLPFPKTKIQENACEFLDPTKASALNRMFMAGESSPEVKQLLSQALSGTGTPVLPMMASSLCAMNVGFFAYKPGLAECNDGQESSEHLHLLTLRTKSLLGGSAPHPHPLGPIWMETPGFILALLQTNEGSVMVHDYKMTVNNTGVPSSHTAVMLHNEAERLENQKGKYEADNCELRKQMLLNTNEITNIKALLKNNAKKAANICGPDRAPRAWNNDETMLESAPPHEPVAET